MQRQRFTHGMAITRQYVEYSGGNTRFKGQLSQTQRRERRFLGGFNDYRVTGGQRRAELPAGHDHREVPRHDGRNHAHRLTGHQAQFVMRCGRDFVVDFVDRFTAPANRARGARYIHAE